MVVQGDRACGAARRERRVSMRALRWGLLFLYETERPVQANGGYEGMSSTDNRKLRDMSDKRFGLKNHTSPA